MKSGETILRCIKKKQCPLQDRKLIPEGREEQNACLSIAFSPDIFLSRKSPNF
jgi:hypothetical protein